MSGKFHAVFTVDLTLSLASVGIGYRSHWMVGDSVKRRNELRAQVYVGL
jgi:hypothetical protein